MTNPAPASGGMPKWLIILLVLLLLIILGCCGGFVACKWACAKAVTGAQGALDAATQRAHNELVAATQRAAEEAKRQAEQGLTTMPEPGNVTPGGPTSGAANAPNAVTIGANNLPADVPLMPGLTSNNIATYDKASGNGMAQFTSKSTPADIAAFYSRQLKANGWTESNNLSINGTTAVIFSRAGREITIQSTPVDGGAFVNIVFDTK